MLTDLKDLLQYYDQILPKLPTWLPFVYFGLILIGLILCLASRHKLQSGGSFMNNTFHTAVWAAVILTVPVFGTLLYIGGSMVPYRLWKRKNPKEILFPYTVYLKKSQMETLVLIGVVGMLVQFFIQQLYELHEVDEVYTSLNYAFEGAFLCWLITIVIDWIQTIGRKAVYLRLESDQAKIRSCDALFGVSYAQDTAVTVTDRRALSIEAETVRGVADQVFNGMVYASDLKGTTGAVPTYSMQEWTYQILAIEKQWRQSGMDVVDARYIGKGVTRYTVCMWEEENGKKSGTERVVYRAVPRFNRWLARAGILQIILLFLFSPWAAAIHLFAARILELFK